MRFSSEGRLPGDVSHEAVARVLFDAAVHAPARAEVQRRREVEAAWEQKHLEDGGILALRRRWLRELRRAQGDRCAYCGTAFVAGTDARATLDHVVALARGGEDTRANCVAACHRCNQLKGAMDVELFRRWRPWLAGATSAVPGTAPGSGASDTP